jgi:tetratricopeptide (TPR) repeat protein
VSASTDEFGPYRVIERLFTDDDADTFRADPISGDGPPMVLKILSSRLSANPGYQEIFRESAELGGRMTHPGVLRILNAGEHMGRKFFAMPWCDGHTLTQVLAALHEQEVVLPPEYAAYLALQVCEALEYSHALTERDGTTVRVVHHDLAPDTLLLGFDGGVRLCEAGAVRASNLEDPTLAVAQVGRPNYFSPERVKGNLPTPRSDIYGLGVITWELLTGRRLFTGSEREEIMAEVLVAPIPSPREYNAEVDEALEAVVMKALERRALRRYPTAGRFRSALSGYLGRWDDAALRAGLVGVMATLFRPEDDQEGLSGQLPAMSEEVARRSDFVKPQNAEPWVREADERGGTPALVWGVVALGVLGAIAAGVWVALPNEPAEPVVTEGAELIAELRKAHPGVGPSVAVAMTESGWDALRMGTPVSIETARDDLEMAVVADPLSPDALAGLALAYSLSETELSLQAVTLLARASEVGGEQPALLRAQAGVALAASNWGPAEERARACLRALPKDALCSWYLGESVYRGGGSLDEAQGYLEEAVVDLPEAPGLQRSFGAVALAKGDYATAAQALERAVRLQPDQPDAHLATAQLYRRTGNYDQALEALERVLNQDPRHQEARFLKGVLLLHVMGDHAAAADVLGGLAEDPLLDDGLALESLVHAGLAALAADRPAEAQGYAERALERAPQHPSAMLLLVSALDAQGKPGEAKSLLQQGPKAGVLSEREHARFLYGVARQWIEYDSDVFSNLALGDAGKADPDWVAVPLAHAMVHARRGALDEALAMIERSWSMDRLVDEGRDPVLQVPEVMIPPLDVWAALDDEFNSVDPRRARIEGILRSWDCEFGGDCKAARDVLATSLYAQPNDLALQVSLARVYTVDGKPSKVVDVLAPLATRSDAPPVLAALLGDALASLGRFDEAEAAYVRGAAGSGPGALERRHAAMLLGLERYEDAHALARAALKRDPDDVHAAGMLLMGR